MNTLTISVSHQLDGYNFSLSPSTRRAIIAKYSAIVPLSLIFVSSENSKSFADIYGRIEKHILPFLTGLEMEELQNLTNKVAFIESTSNTLLYELVLKNVKEKQSLPG